MSGILDELRYFFYRRSIGKNSNLEKERESLHFADVKSIGIIFNGTEIEAYEPVRDFKRQMESKSKRVKVLGYINANNANRMMQYDMFSRKDLTWNLKPKSAFALNFTEMKFDLLINAYVDVLPPLEYISMYSEARFRVGLYFPENTGLSDMMLSIDGKPNMHNFFTEVNRCLNIYQNNA